MPVLIKVSQNKNDKTAAYGKWYGRVVSTKTMSYQELCKHMSEHNSIYGEDVCLGVANKLQSCMLEQLLEGKKVQFGELGTFYLSVKSSGADKEEDYNLGVNIKGLYLCFAPSRTDVNNLSSKMLKKKATFMNVKDLVESKQKTSNSGSSNGSTDSGNNGSTNSSGSNSGSSNSETPGTEGGGTPGSGTSETVAAPTFAGETQFTESTQVTISGPDGASIYYTTDGSVPTSASTQYAEPLTFTETTILKAIAIKDGQSSSVTTRTYTKTDGNGGDEMDQN